LNGSFRKTRCWCSLSNSLISNVLFGSGVNQDLDETIKPKSSVNGVRNIASVEGIRQLNLQSNPSYMRPSCTFRSLMNDPTRKTSLTRSQCGSSHIATLATRPHKHFGGSSNAVSFLLSTSADFIDSITEAIDCSASHGGSPFLTAAPAAADARGNL
jgi:hypothetical protein